MQGNEMGFLGLGKVFHVVTGAVKGFAEGGPVGAAAGAGKSVLSEVQKAKLAKARRKAFLQQQRGLSGYIAGCEMNNYVSRTHPHADAIPKSRCRR